MSTGKRPVPRKSALAGLSPVNSTGESHKTGTAGNAVQTGTAGNTSHASTDKEKITVRIDRDLLEQVRGAQWSTALATSTPSLQAWIEDALAAYLQHQERLFNDGAPFPRIVKNTIPTGYAARSLRKDQS